MLDGAPIPKDQPETVYCIYADEDVTKSETNWEHIVPLSLGGHNAFGLQVHREANSRFGTGVDGGLANDFFIQFRRRAFDARGHSRTPVAPRARRSAFIEQPDRPLQVTFADEKIAVWDAKGARELQAEEVIGKQLTSKITVSYVAPVRFLAKVALAAGYFSYGDLFRQHVAHEELRYIAGPAVEKDARRPAGFRTILHTPLAATGGVAPPKDIALFKALCNWLAGSVVILIPTNETLAIVVGVLSEYLGTIEVPANTTVFPHDGDHDRGHVIFCSKSNRLIRSSYLVLATEFAKAFDLPITSPSPSNKS